MYKSFVSLEQFLCKTFLSDLIAARNESSFLLCFIYNFIIFSEYRSNFKKSANGKAEENVNLQCMQVLSTENQLSKSAHREKIWPTVNPAINTEKIWPSSNLKGIQISSLNENTENKDSTLTNVPTYQYRNDNLKKLKLEETISNIIDHRFNGQTVYQCQKCKKHFTTLKELDYHKMICQFSTNIQSNQPKIDLSMDMSENGKINNTKIDLDFSNASDINTKIDIQPQNDKNNKINQDFHDETGMNTKIQFQPQNYPKNLWTENHDEQTQISFNSTKKPQMNNNMNLQLQNYNAKQNQKNGTVQLITVDNWIPNEHSQKSNEKKSNYKSFKQAVNSILTNTVNGQNSSLDHTENQPEFFMCNFCKKMYNAQKALEYHQLSEHKNLLQSKSGLVITNVLNQAQNLNSTNSVNSANSDMNTEKTWPTLNPAMNTEKIWPSSNQVINKNHTGVPSQNLTQYLSDYPCEFCGKKFTKRYSLKRHKRLHTQSPLERSFPCEFCASLFLNKDSLRRHYRQSCAKNRVMVKIEGSGEEECKLVPKIINNTPPSTSNMLPSASKSIPLMVNSIPQGTSDSIPLVIKNAPQVTSISKTVPLQATLTSKMTPLLMKSNPQLTSASKTMPVMINSSLPKILSSSNSSPQMISTLPQSTSTSKIILKTTSIPKFLPQISSTEPKDQLNSKTLPHMISSLPHTTSTPILMPQMTNSIPTAPSTLKLIPQVINNTPNASTSKKVTQIISNVPKVTTTTKTIPQMINSVSATTSTLKIPENTVPVQRISTSNIMPHKFKSNPHISNSLLIPQTVNSTAKATLTSYTAPEKSVPKSTSSTVLTIKKGVLQAISTSDAEPFKSTSQATVTSNTVNEMKNLTKSISTSNLVPPMIKGVQYVSSTRKTVPLKNNTVLKGTSTLNAYPALIKTFPQITTTPSIQPAKTTETLKTIPLMATGTQKCTPTSNSMPVFSVPQGTSISNQTPLLINSVPINTSTSNVISNGVSMQTSTIPPSMRNGIPVATSISNTMPTLIPQSISIPVSTPLMTNSLPKIKKTSQAQYPIITGNPQTPQMPKSMPLLIPEATLTSKTTPQVNLSQKNLPIMVNGVPHINSTPNTMPLRTNSVQNPVATSKMLPVGINDIPQATLTPKGKSPQMPSIQQNNLNFTHLSGNGAQTYFHYNPNKNSLPLTNPNEARKEPLDFSTSKRQERYVQKEIKPSTG